MMHTTRVWDLPTRLFHWALLVCVVGLIVTAKVGGNAMNWHFRLGHTVMALLLFRLLWGILGGRWSRFTSFLYAPRTVLQYVRGSGGPELSVGHSPTGAGSVFAMLGFLVAQVATGLVSDDEIAFAGPLARFVSGATVSLASWYHKAVGQWVVIGLIVLHLAAVLYYLWGKKQNLIGPMVHGDKQVAMPVAASRDDATSRAVALVLMAGCGAVAGWVYRLGG